MLSHSFSSTPLHTDVLPPQMFSGVAMALLILCGFAGSAVTGIAADRTKAFTPITKLFYGCAAIFAIIMMEVSLRRNIT